MIAVTEGADLYHIAEPGMPRTECEHCTRSALNCSSGVRNKGSENAREPVVQDDGSSNNSGEGEEEPADGYHSEERQRLNKRVVEAGDVDMLERWGRNAQEKRHRWSGFVQAHG